MLCAPSTPLPMMTGGTPLDEAFKFMSSAMVASAACFSDMAAEARRLTSSALRFSRSISQRSSEFCSVSAEFRLLSPVNSSSRALCFSCTTWSILTASSARTVADSSDASRSLIFIWAIMLSCVSFCITAVLTV